MSPLIDPPHPSSPTSGGALLGLRSTLEEQYLDRLSGEIEWFMGEAFSEARRARESNRVLTVAAVFVLWGAVLARVEAWLPRSSALYQQLGESELPAQVAGAVQREATTSAALAVTGVAALDRLRTVLGLSREPVEGMGGEFGKLLTGEAAADGATTHSTNWESLGEKWARTAATADFGESMLNQLRAEGYTHKRWITRYDSRVRDSHQAVDAVTIPVEESFIVGGAALRYPADPTGPIEETANCRCVLVGVRFGQHELDHPEGTEPWNNPRPL